MVSYRMTRTTNCHIKAPVHAPEVHPSFRIRKSEKRYRNSFSDSGGSHTIRVRREFGLGYVKPAALQVLWLHGLRWFVLPGCISTFVIHHEESLLSVPDD